jgi:hypothetical protein
MQPSTCSKSASASSVSETKVKVVAKADGWTIRVFVLRVLPPREEHPEDPVFTLGGNVGEAAEIGGSTPVAARLHRIAYVIDTRPLRAPRPLICVRYGSRGDRS